MCGRYALELNAEEVVKALGAHGLNVDHVYDKEKGIQSLNIAPTSYQPVFYSDKDVHNLRYMRWGLVPSFAHEHFKFPTHNCKADSLIHLKPVWRCAKTRRAAVPMQGYYEWHTENKKKKPYFFKDKSNDLMCVLGIWDYNEKLKEPTFSFSIVTTDASDSVKGVHNRMPCIVTFKDAIEWVDGKWPQVLDLMTSKDDLLFYRVSTAVNKIGSTGALTEPIKEESESDEDVQTGSKRQHKINQFFTSKKIKKES